MSPTFYYILHVSSIIALSGYTFYAFGAPPETRKRVLMLSGIFGILALVGGFGLQAKLGYGFPGWLIVKFLCWLALMALAGFGYRRRGAAGALAIVTLVLIVVAVTMVYTKPF